MPNAIVKPRRFAAAVRLFLAVSALSVGACAGPAREETFSGGYGGVSGGIGQLSTAVR